MNANYSNFLTAPLSLSYNWTPATVTNLSGDGKNNQFQKFDVKINSTEKNILNSTDGDNAIVKLVSILYSFKIL